MKSQFYLLLIFSLLISISCESDSPSPSADIRIKGFVKNKLNEAPVIDVSFVLSIQANAAGTQINEVLNVDGNGEYSYEIQDFRQFLIGRGVAETEVDSLLSFGIVAGLESNIGMDSCKYISADPNAGLRRLEIFENLPIDVQWDFSVFESKALAFQYVDTATNPRDNKIIGSIDVNELGTSSYLGSWEPIEEEFIGTIAGAVCLPIDVPVVVSYTFQSFSLDNMGNKDILSTWIISDTVTMTKDGLPLLEIPY